MVRRWLEHSGADTWGVFCYKQKLRYAGHVARLPVGRAARYVVADRAWMWKAICFHLGGSQLHGHRWRGSRPDWERDLAAACRAACKGDPVDWQTAARDRDVWRDIVAAAAAEVHCRGRYILRACVAECVLLAGGRGGGTA